jgi:hypothetical protein
MRTLLFTRVLALGVGVASAAAATSAAEHDDGAPAPRESPSSPSGAQREPAPVTESRHVEHHQQAPSGGRPEERGAVRPTRRLGFSQARTRVSYFPQKTTCAVLRDAVDAGCRRRADYPVFLNQAELEQMPDAVTSLTASVRRKPRQSKPPASRAFDRCNAAAAHVAVEQVVRGERTGGSRRKDAGALPMLLFLRRSHTRCRSRPIGGRRPRRGGAAASVTS